MWLPSRLGLCCIAAASACAPYEYYDAAALANVSAKFGAPYTILAKPEPSLSLDGQRLEFTARLKTSCTHVVPQFSISEAEAHDLGKIFVAIRSEPACSSLQGKGEKEWTGRVAVRLPAADGVEARLLAFPPGSEYELWKIDLVARLPAPAKVRLYVHRAQPKIENPNGPCSTMLTVAPGTAMPELLAMATQILGIRVVALRAEEDPDSPLHELVDQASLVAFEAPRRADVHQPLDSLDTDTPHAEAPSVKEQGGEPNCTHAAAEKSTLPYIFAQL